MIRYLDEREKLRSRKLWEEAFPEDSRSFDDYYFAEKLKDNRILAREEDGALAAMIQLNPYRIQAAGRQWQTDYLVGVATRKASRHRGYMRSLLLRMMADMRKAHMPFCFLMPADEAIYRPFGFTYIFRQPVWRLKKEETLEQRELISDQETWEAGFAADWMNRWLEARYEVFAVRDPAYVRRLLKELASEKGSFRLLYDREQLVGMISDWGLETREQRLLYCQEDYIEEAGPAKPAIMARIITPEEFVQVIRLRQGYPGEEAVIRLRLWDPLIAENDGWWEWHITREGSWMKPMAGMPEGERAAQDARQEEADPAEKGGYWKLELTIEELTAWLFGYQVPEKAGALKPVVRPLRGVFLDEIV